MAEPVSERIAERAAAAVAGAITGLLVALLLIWLVFEFVWFDWDGWWLLIGLPLGGGILAAIFDEAALKTMRKTFHGLADVASWLWPWW